MTGSLKSIQTLIIVSLRYTDRAMISLPDDAVLSDQMRDTVMDILIHFREIPSINAVYLFGSRLKGTPKPYSDIDLCVFFCTPPSRSEKEYIGSFAAPLVDISLFEELPVAIRFRVLRDGKPLFVKNELTLHRSVVAALREYHDFRHVIDRCTARVAGGAGL